MPEDTGRKLDTHRYKNQSQVLCPGMLLMVRCLMRMIRTRYHPGLKFLGRHIHQLLKTLLFVDGLSPHEKRRLCHKYDHRQDGQSAYDAGEDGKGDQEAEKAHGYEIAEKEDKKSHHHRESVIHDPFADGGHLYKKRIAIDGKGKRGSLRTIVAFKKEDKAFFVYGYAKNSIENITEAELEALKELAKIYFSYGDVGINNAVKSKKFIEVTNNE